MAASLLVDARNLSISTAQIEWRQQVDQHGPSPWAGQEWCCPMTPPVDTSDPRWHLVVQVLNSPVFEKSPRLRAFLTFICELELTGRHLDINEQQIGIHVFGRAPGGNPRDDSIVRSQARFLRQRLEEYFRGVGLSEPMRITIPKGSYVPVFEPNPAAAPFPVPDEAAAQPDGTVTLLAQDASSTKSNVHRVGAGKNARSVLAIALFAFLVIGIAVFVYYRREINPVLSPEARFWNSIFDPHRGQVIVPADSTLILIEELTGEQVSFQNYLNREYLSNIALPKSLTTLTSHDLENSRYTSMADLNLVSRIVRVPQVRQMRAEIRYARDLSISDAKEDNLILVGGPRANPWVELFARHMNFYVDYDWKTKQNSVINKAPRSGEQPLYAESDHDSAHRVYGLICYESSLDNEGDALLVAGTSSAGTQSAADFLLSGRALGEFLRQVQRKDGSIPHFELLLEARNVGGNVPDSSIVAYRLVP
jgi:hypothetical protein